MYKKHSLLPPIMTLLRIKKVGDVADVNYHKEGDVAIDLRASGVFVIALDNDRQEVNRDAYELQPRERVLIKTGIQVQLPKGHWGNIRDRSGLAMKHGIHQLGGVIDENYRGEIGVVVVNMGTKPYTITKNERIAQMVIAPYTRAGIEYVNDLDESSRGSQSFGDSGTH